MTSSVPLEKMGPLKLKTETQQGAVTWHGHSSSELEAGSRSEAESTSDNNEGTELSESVSENSSMSDNEFMRGSGGCSKSEGALVGGSGRPFSKRQRNKS